MSVFAFLSMGFFIGLYCGCYLGERRGVGEIFTALRNLVKAMESNGYKPWSKNDELDHAYWVAKAIISKEEEVSHEQSTGC